MHHRAHYHNLSAAAAAVGRRGLGFGVCARENVCEVNYGLEPIPRTAPAASGGRSAKFRQAKNGMQRQPLRSRTGYMRLSEILHSRPTKNETILPHARRVFCSRSSPIRGFCI